MYGKDYMSVDWINLNVYSMTNHTFPTIMSLHLCEFKCMLPSTVSQLGYPILIAKVYAEREPICPCRLILKYIYNLTFVPYYLPRRRLHL
jgi:hypothetical protein